MHWTETHYYPLLEKGQQRELHKGREDRYDCWADMVNLKLTRKTVEGAFLQRTFFTSKDGTIHYMPDINMSQPIRDYMKYPDLKVDGESVDSRVRNEVIFSHIDSAHIEEEKTVYGKMKIHYSSWEREEVVLNGKKTLKFVRTISYEEDKNKSYKMTIIWADPFSMQIVRREIRHDGTNVHVRTIAENFREQFLLDPILNSDHLCLDKKNCLSEQQIKRIDYLDQHY